MGGCSKCKKGFMTNQELKLIETIVFDYFSITTLYDVKKQFCSNVLCDIIRNYTAIISREKEVFARPIKKVKKRGRPEKEYIE